MMFDPEQEIQAWLRTLRSSPGFEDGDIEEIEIHIRDAMECSMADGVSPEEAFRRVMASFGPADRMGEEYLRSRTADLRMPKRDVLAPNYKDSTFWLAERGIRFGNHLKFMLRTIRKNKNLSILNILGMALGLAAAGIILTYVHQETHFDNQLKNSAEIYRVLEKEGDRYDEYGYAPLAEALRDELPEVEASLRVAFYFGFLACRNEENGFNERSALFVDPNFFQFFTFPLIHGTSGNCLPDPHAVVLSESAAHKYFGDENPLGKPLEIGDGRMHTVTAVFRDFPVNSNFRGDILLPLESISEMTQIWIDPGWEHHSDINTFARLAKGTSPSELAGKTQQFFSRHLENSGPELHFQSLSDIHTNRKFLWESNPQANPRILRILSLIAFLILGVSAINFLFLYIGIASQRTTGTGIRKVYGASRLRLFGEHFKEISFLMFCSLLAAILLVAFYLQVLVPNGSLPDLVTVDTSLLLLLMGILLLTVVVAGVYPSSILSSRNVLSLLHPWRDTTRHRYRAFPVLSIVQFVFLLSLLSFTLLADKQSRYMLARDTGYARGELHTIPMSMPLGHGIHGEGFEAFVQEMEKLPGIEAVTASFSSPASAECFADGIGWEGQLDEKKREVIWSWESVSFDYFRTLGVDILQGRDFDRSHPADALNWDTRECAFIINESGLRELGVEDPLGKTFTIWGFKGPIVGIAKDYHFLSMHSETRPMFYFMQPAFWNEIVVRSAAGQAFRVEGMEQIWTRFCGDAPFELNSVEDQLRDLYGRERGLSRILRVFSLLTILVLGIGLVTLSLLSFNQRKKEIGIRKVHGATSSAILWMLNKKYAGYVLLSCLIALPPTGFLMHKWLANYANRTSMSGWIFLAAGGITLLIALGTTSWKSRQAARKNPVEALRTD